MIDRPGSDSGISATSEVQTSYYGFPVIRAPHWRWLIIFYFFFGGIAGSTFTIASLVELLGKDRHVARMARYISFAALLPCPPLLVLDLGRPERFLNMLRIVKLRSPMSLGSWALTFFSVFSSAAALLQLASDIGKRDFLPGTRRAVAILGLPFSVFLSGYTGILLAATNVPLWWRASPVLTPTFISSAYSTGLAAMSLALGFGGREQKEANRRLAKAEALCMTVELTALTALVIRTGKIGRPLTTGKLGVVFWPVTYLGGIVLPLILQLHGPVRGHPSSRPRHTLTALLTLVGGLSLRTLMIFAGRESANRPEDYFWMTRTPSPAGLPPVPGRGGNGERRP